MMLLMFLIWNVDILHKVLRIGQKDYNLMKTQMMASICSETKKFFFIPSLWRSEKKGIFKVYTYEVSITVSPLYTANAVKAV